MITLVSVEIVLVRKRVRYFFAEAEIVEDGQKFEGEETIPLLFN